MTRRIGAKSSNARALPTISMIRLITQKNFLRIIPARKIRIQGRIAGPLGNIVIPFFRKQMKGDADLIELLRAQVVAQASR